MNISDTISSVIIQGAIALGPFAALVLIRRKPQQPFLIAIIMCLSLIVSHSYFIRGAIGHFIESPFIIAEPFIFLISPLMYFYFANITSSQIRLSWTDLKHTIPFFVFFASFVPTFLHGKNTVYYDFMYSNKSVMTGLLWIILTYQFLYYYSKIYRLNKNYTTRLAQQHSNYLQYDASWIRMFLILFLAILAFVSMVLFVFLHNSSFAHFSTVVALFFSVQVYFVAYKGLNQKTITLEKDAFQTATSTVDEPAGKVDHQKFLAEKEMLENYMYREKPYLNPDLTLTELATRVGMSRNELSALINNVMDSNFYLYINEYRIAHVKHLIQQDVKKQYTLLALAYDSGFNSKSTFNALFKKITGLTPTEYRDTLG